MRCAPKLGSQQKSGGPKKNFPGALRRNLGPHFKFASYAPDVVEYGLRGYDLLDLLVWLLAHCAISSLQMLGIAAKFDIDDLRYSTETVKNAVWLSFVNNITRF